jgi:hypothetical protein
VCLKFAVVVDVTSVTFESSSHQQIIKINYCWFLGDFWTRCLQSVSFLMSSSCSFRILCTDVDGSPCVVLVNENQR